MAYKVFTNGSVLNASEVNDNLMNQAVITFTNSTARASAITSPVEGMVTYLADTDTYQFWNGSAWTNLVSSTIGTGNAIINSAFDIWQRGTTFTNQTSGAFSADRWRVSTSNNTIDVSRSTFTLGAAPLAGLDGKFFATIAAEAADTGPTFTQPIEGAQTFAGQTVTVSFYAKSSITTDALRWIRLRQNFGTGGSPSASVDTDSSAITLTGSWARYTVTLTLPSISGKTLGTNGNDCLELQIGLKASTAQTLDIWGVQIESGSSATQFRRNGNNITEELASCQRYYYRQGGDNTVQYMAVGNAVSSTETRFGIIPPVTMRANPSSVEFSTLATYDVGAASIIAVTTCTLNVATRNINALQVNVASGLTNYRPLWLIANSSANGYVALNAEL